MHTEQQKRELFRKAEKAGAFSLPYHTGDGYGYGGGTILTLGEFAFPFGEGPEARELALELARRWNAASTEDSRP